MTARPQEVPPNQPLRRTGVWQGRSARPAQPLAQGSLTPAVARRRVGGAPGPAWHVSDVPVAL